MYVIVRCTAAGVHAGELVNRQGTEVTLRNSRRIWYWKGAASLSELAVHGMQFPAECKFGVPLKEITVLDACEVIPCEPAAEKMIRECPEWRV